MKKSIGTIAVVVVLAFSLLLPAMAFNQEFIADELNALGLIRGTDDGYDLETPPTRGQAVVMLIRLLGLEDEALGGGRAHPFGDVPGWLSDYIAFAYENELTAGVTPTTFQPDDLCTAQMYVTFVLRALGYDDSAGDFTFAEAIPFAMSVGIIDSELAAGSFLRNELVAVSYLALSTAPVGGEYDSLLEKLVSDGAIDMAAAMPVLERFSLYEEFSLVGSELDDETKIAIDVTMDMDMGILGSVAARMGMSMIIEGYDILASVDMTAEMAGIEIDMEMYIYDGYVYVSADGEKFKMDAGLAGIEDMLALAELGEMTLNPLYLIKNITKSTSGDLTVFTITFVDGFINAAMTEAMSAAGSMPADLGIDMDISIPEMRIYADSSGAIRRIGFAMDMVMDDLGVSVVMDIVITAVGDAVTVTLPDDLDEYILID